MERGRGDGTCRTVKWLLGRVNLTTPELSRVCKEFLVEFKVEERFLKRPKSLGITRETVFRCRGLLSQLKTVTWYVTDQHTETIPTEHSDKPKCTHE